MVRWASVGEMSLLRHALVSVLVIFYSCRETMQLQKFYEVAGLGGVKTEEGQLRGTLGRGVTEVKLKRLRAGGLMRRRMEVYRRPAFSFL